MFSYVYTNEAGDLFVDDQFQALGRTGKDIVEPLPEEMIPMPEGATFVLIPDRKPVVMKFDSFIPYPYPENKPVGAILPQGYTRTLMPAFLEPEEGDQILPLFGYTMVGYRDGEFYVAAMKTDEDKKWNPEHFNTQDLSQRINKMKNIFPKNALVKHLSNCAINYSCFTAQNIFYKRWEGGIPVSPVCNANCLGCISLQPSECCPSPQDRITFVPTVAEIAQLGIYHLQEEDSIISFGQGCEGEPTLQSKVIAESIKKIRETTKVGTINCNTNAGYTKGIKEIVDAGIDSLRVSINSAVEETYNSYYMPGNYSLADVGNSLKYAAENNCYTYLNLLVLPGVNDTEEEIEKLVEFIKDNKVKEVQFRNLNIDPDRYLDKISIKGEALGILALKEILEKELLELKTGNYSKPVKRNT